MKSPFFAALTVLAVLGQVSSTPKVSPTLMDKLRNGITADIMIIVAESTTSTVMAEINTRRFTTSADKSQAMVQRLKEKTSEDQRPILAEISKQKSTSDVKGFYITNRISVTGASLSLVESLAGRNDIAEIREAKVVTIETPVLIEENDDPEEVQPRMAEQWGVQRVGAPSCWAEGIDGSNVTVANIDTGVRSTHEALAYNYRGAYGWFDPYLLTNEPNDQNGHGTHTMGTIAGAGGIGVAPGATWIACKGCDTSSCSEAALLQCGQWTYCPTLPDGSAEDCSMRPHVCSNSWGGGQGDPFYDDILRLWDDAGIIGVFAIGNSGSSCQTVNSPGDRPNVISVGSTGMTDQVSTFSSRGVSSVGIKPECAAPGENVYSSIHSGDNAYATASGTSMAAPHVAGAVTLMLQEYPYLTLKDILEAFGETAYQPADYRPVCRNGLGSTSWPNNEMGFGRINVADAMYYANSTFPSF